VTRARLPLRRSGLTRACAAELAEQENRRFVALVADLNGSDWELPTDCPDWSVRRLVAHVLGAMEGQVSHRELLHQALAGRREAGDGTDLDGMTAVQVRDRDHLTPTQLVKRLTAVAPRAARARAGRSTLMRGTRFTQDLPVVGRDRWTGAYLLDAIWTRDTWMHRVDVSRASVRPMLLTPEHDGRIVADVARDWAERHGRPVTLTLTGPAGYVLHTGERGEALTMDAVEFCRTLSGRAADGGLLEYRVPF
jgi:uncharacterized protein (TIGR03083 family)